jgi:hypothetical protein
MGTKYVSTSQLLHLSLTHTNGIVAHQPNDMEMMFPRTLAIFCLLIREAFFGAITRAPFLGARTFGLGEEEEMLADVS